jgi:hypothetical protein
MQQSSKGQALPEYLLTTALLLAFFILGSRAWIHALGQAEARQAWTFLSPAP